MADFPASAVCYPKLVLYSHGRNSLLGWQQMMSGISTTSGVWPSINRALFTPVTVEVPVLAQQMSVQIVTQSGNIDVGIYTEKGAKVVTAGTTAVGAAGPQVFNITDTVLNPGTYFLAVACDNTTVSVQKTAVTAANANAAGHQIMASAFVLPTTATFANPSGTGYQPLVSVLCVATA